MKLLTTDNQFIDWPFAPEGVTTITLTAEELRALRAPVALARILAHGSLRDAQIDRLYSCRKRGLRLRRVARRIIELDIADLCAGIGEQRLTDTITLRADGATIRAELLRLRVREHDEVQTAFPST